MSDTNDEVLMTTSRSQVNQHEAMGRQAIAAHDLAQLRQRLEAAERDAARLDWLESCGNLSIECYAGMGRPDRWTTDDGDTFHVSARAAIDAEMQRQEERT